MVTDNEQVFNAITNTVLIVFCISLVHYVLNLQLWIPLKT